MMIMSNTDMYDINIIYINMNFDKGDGGYGRRPRRHHV